MNNSEDFKTLIGFSPEKIDAQQLKVLMVNAFVYREKMADVSINTINKNDEDGIVMTKPQGLN